MASNTNPPSTTMGEFELPPTADMAAQSRKEVSWSATPDEIDQETINKRKKRVKYEMPQR
jgi:hypothetical protein